MRKLFTLSVLIGIGVLLFLNGEDVDNENRSEAEDKSHFLSSEAYFEHKKQKRKEGYAKADAPEMHARMERLRRIPMDLESPAYRENYLMEEYLKLKNSNSQNARTASTLEFIERGPGNVAGRTRGLIVDPDDPTHKTWFAGSASGGIWKTADGGENWALISQDIPNLGTNTLAMSPANTQVIYAGTGEHFIDAIDGSGMFKSTDKGQSWTQIASPDDFPDFKNISRIIVDPNDENTVLATTRNSLWASASEFRSSIYKSTDGGATWKRVYTSTDFRLDDLDYEPGNFSVMYAALQAKGVIKSTDGGETWEDASFGLNPSGRVEITVSNVNKQYIWASAQGNESGTGSDLYLSKNGGESWSLVFEKNDENIHFLGGQGWYDNIITAHPFDENIVYVGGVNTFKFTLGEGTTNVAVISAEEEGTAGFLSFINFGGSFVGGTIDRGDISDADLVTVEIRFGVGTQKAHRFTVNGRGSGVPDGDYIYNDYVEIPFQVWDVTNNQQLMVSFRDQQEDGEWNLISTNTTPGDEANHSREYVFIHTTPYEEQADPDIAVQGGVGINQQYFFWPVLTEGGSFDKDALPESIFRITKNDLEAFQKEIEIVSDAYDDFNSNNNFSNSDFINQTGLHPDQHNIIMIVDDSSTQQFRMLIANDGGLYLSENSVDPALTDNTFEFVSNGYNSTQFYGADKAPRENRYIGGMQDNSTWFTPEGVEADAATVYTLAFGGDGFEAIWNNRNPDLIIGSIQFNLFVKSSDGGNSWQVATDGITDDGPFYSRLANSNDLPDRIFTVGSSGVWKSIDFGDTWTSTPITSQWSFNNRTDITVSEANPNYIWAGGNLSENQRIFVSTNGGTSFTPVNNYDGTTLGFCSGLGTHPHDPNIGYALFSFAGRPKVLKTTDLGQSWEDISGFEGNNGVSDRGFPDVAVNCILVFPNNPDRIWVGSELGIVESLDGGENWSYVEEMPSVNIYDFKIKDDQIVIATYGRGIWSVTIPEVQNELAIFDAGTSPKGDISIRFNYTKEYDSTLVSVNGQRLLKLDETNGGQVIETINNLDIQGSATLPFRVEYYRNGKLSMSGVSDQTIFEIGKISDTYAANFSTVGSEDDFVSDGFMVENIDNFDSEAFSSELPYLSDREYFTILRNPIIVDAENPIISYRDVALVEPGETGAVFGDPKFRDYVVVEGTKDGLTWMPLKGYDAGANENWLDAFNRGQDGSKDLMINQEIDLTSTFNPNDTILIRFRLVSDNLVNGFGWVIDDLKIQTTEDFDALLNTEETLKAVSIYPNPATEFINVSYNLNSSQGAILLRNMNGQLITRVEVAGKGLHKIERQNLPDGIYIVQIQSGDKIESRKIVIQ